MMETKDHADVLNAVAAELNKRAPEPHAPGRDQAGYDCPIELLGRTFVHTARGTIYKVIGWSWDSERELWLVNYANVNPTLSAIPYSRTVANFTGRSEKTSGPRFVEIHDVASISPPIPAMPT